MKLIFAIPIKFNGTNVAREEKRKKEKKLEESRNKRCFFFLFLSFFIQLVAPSSEFLEWNRLPNVLLDLDAVTFYIWNATCKIRVQQSRVAVVSIPFLLLYIPSVLFLVERVGYYTIFLLARKIHDRVSSCDVFPFPSTFVRRPRLISRSVEKNGQKETNFSSWKDNQVAHRFGVIKTGKRGIYALWYNYVNSLIKRG